MPRRQPGLLQLQGFLERVDARLAPCTFWQFHATGHARLFLTYATFQPVVASVELPMGGVSPMLVYPGPDVFLSFDGDAGSQVLICTLGPMGDSSEAT